MKKILVFTAILMFAGSAVVFAQEEKTIKGEVIDVSCYVSAGAKGMDHKTCALACLQAGEPAGILEDGTGKVYVVITEDHKTNPSQKMIPYVAKTVEATGVVNERGGVSTIDITNIKEIGESSSMGMSNTMGMNEEMSKEDMGMHKEGMGMMKEEKGM